jgi:hypothetical protein
MRIHLLLSGAAALLVSLGCSSEDPDCRSLSDSHAPACAPKPGAPSFGGVTNVATDAAGNFVVSWQPATDAATPPEKIVYRVYVSRAQGRALHQTPTVTAPGATSAVVHVPTDEDFYVMARAVNEAGLEDGNIVEMQAKSSPDREPPTFEGVKSTTPVDGRGIRVAWTAGFDDRTPPELLRYVVYGGAGDAVDYSKPLKETAEGATEATFPGLGKPNESWSFVVLARDLAGNLSTDKHLVTGALGKATEPPAFAGCKDLVVDGKSITVRWDPATSPFASSDPFTYQIYMSTTAGGEQYGAPPAANISGATETTFANLTPGTTYYFVCRASDSVGNTTQNTDEKSAAVSADVTAPTFAGITNSVFDGSARTVQLEWSPASDNTSAPADIVYEVYERSSTGTFDFTAPPRAVSTAGASSIVVDDLTPQATLFWVVRARDAALNRDANSVEATGTTNSSFSRQIVPLIRRNCAVVGCHSSGFPTGGMLLSPAFTYNSIVNVPAGQKPPGRATPINRITPGDLTESYLYYKITAGTADAPGPIVGNPMPAPGTGNALTPAEKTLVKTWILEGAVRN